MACSIAASCHNYNVNAVLTDVEELERTHLLPLHVEPIEAQMQRGFTLCYHGDLSAL